MEDIGDTSWMEDGRCRRPGVDTSHWVRGIDKTKLSKQLRSLALAECELCPVQWECVSFAIRTLDDWNVCAVEVDDRRLLAARPDWQGLVDMAEESRMTVTNLVVHLRSRGTT